jgi:hypothetical protein
VASKAAKPKCCAYQPPVANKQVQYFFSSFVQIFQVVTMHAGGHPCITASPSHHMTVPAHFFSRPSAYIRLGRPPLHSVVHPSIRLTACFLSSLSAHGSLLRVSCSDVERAVTLVARRRVGVSSDGASDVAQSLGFLPVEILCRPTATQRLFFLAVLD